MRAVFHLFGFYPGICLTTEVKARRTLSHIGNINSSKPRKELRAAHGPQRRSKQLLYSRRGCACAHTVRCVPRYSAASEHVTILPVAYQARGGCSNPPPRNSEGPPKSCQTQPDWENCLKIAEFRTPTHQDVRKKGSKILKLPRFAIVLH